MKTQIAVVGCDCRLSPELLKISDLIGEEIAKSGCVLLCGGRGGVMEAACRGAKRAGGLTVGILPSLNKEDANPYVDIGLTTGLGPARNALVVASADVVIAVNGGEGTLSEVALALNYGKTVLAVKGSGGVSGVLEEKLKEMGIRGRVLSVLAEEAVKKALEEV